MDQLPVLSDALGRFGPTCWVPPAHMSALAWRQLGEYLAKSQDQCQWWIGDWWVSGEHAYGARKAMTQADDWCGPTYNVCYHAGLVARRFATVRRRTHLTFKHHYEVSPLPPEEADAMLDWAEQTNASTRQLREHIKVSKPNMDGLTNKQIGEKLLAWCDERQLSRESHSHARRVCRADIELAKKVLRGDITLNQAHEKAKALERVERERAAAAHEAALAAAPSNVRRLPTIEERDAEARRIAHNVPLAVAMLYEASKANIAPVWLQKDMTADEIEEVDAHAAHAMRYLKYVIETWAHAALTAKKGDQP